MRVTNFILVSFLLVALDVGSAAEPADPTGRTSEKPLPTLTISLYKTTLVQGEPLIVALCLTNKSEKPLRGFYSSNEHFANGTIEIEGSSADDSPSFRQTYSLGVHQLWGLHTPLAPGASRRCEKIYLPLVLSPSDTPKRTTLPPGQYRVAATVQATVPVTSEAVEFHVKPAKPEDQQALELMASRRVAGFLAGLAYSHDLPDGMSKLLEKFPDSVYAPYVKLRHILDKSEYFWRVRRKKFSEEDKKDISETIAEAIEFVRNNPHMPLADNVLLNCARLQRILQNRDECITTLTRIVKEHPNSDANEAALLHLQSWAPETLRTIAP